LPKPLRAVEHDAALLAIAALSAVGRTEKETRKACRKLRRMAVRRLMVSHGLRSLNDDAAACIARACGACGGCKGVANI
jgi:uncharacterized protein YbcC (UPF0753/DUF2309 family)